MSIGLTTGIKALFAAQLSMQTAGHNIANAHVKGYSRQSVMLRTDDPLHMAGLGYLGTGVRTDGIIRSVDDLLEIRIQEQNRSLGRLDRETSVLSQMEDILQEINGSGLSSLFSKFFGSMNALSMDPADPTLKSDTVHSGKILADGFHHLAYQLDGLSKNIHGEIESKAAEVNLMAQEIFALNKKIAFAASSGIKANDLYDKRGQIIKELNRIVDTQVVNESMGGVTVLVNGRILASGHSCAALEVKKNADGLVTVHLEDDPNPLDIRDGEIKGLLNLNNDSIPGLKDRIDTLAGQLAFAFNRVHSTGIPGSGPFTTLRSSNRVSDLNHNGNPNDEPLAEAGLPFIPKAGELFVTVTNQTTGALEQIAIQVDPAKDGLESVAEKLDGIPHLHAWADSNGRLVLKAASGYGFDFAPRLDPAPDKTGSFGTVSVALEGRYTGEENTTWTFEAASTGTVGVTPGLTVTVRDASGDMVAILDVGEGYAPGDPIEVAEGVMVSFGSGDLDVTAPDAFEAKMIADADTGGLLAALGLNAFFTGRAAADLQVHGDLDSDPSRIATGLSPNSGDNANVLRMLALEDQSIEDLDSSSIIDYYAATVGHLGLESAWAKDMHEIQEVLLANLENQRASVSGVSIDEELLNLQKYQQMLEAAVRYLQVLDESMNVIMNM